MLFQSTARLENHTKMSYPCNTFCESTRLRDVFSCSQQENVTVTSSRRMCHICMTSVPRLHDITFWWRITHVLRTCPWQVLDKCFQVLLQSPQCLETRTKTCYPCNTFCESTRLHDVFSCYQQEHFTVRSSRRLCHICMTSVPRLHDITFWWRITHVLRTCP